MKNEERVLVHTFIATGATPQAAIDAAAEQLQAWYGAQSALWTMDGDSLFRFGMWLFLLPSGEYQYVITALDTRPKAYQGTP